MMILFAGLLVLGTAAPYLLPRRGMTPMSGATLWLSVLALRAVLVVSAALIAILYLPATALFRLMTHWCIHAVVPFVATHLGFSGHGVGDAATLLPALVLGISLISALFALFRAARTVRMWVLGSSLGPGPRGSVIVGGSEVLVAAAGIRNPEIVVSAGALIQLDDEELAASLEHERGHVARHHPYFAVAANLAFALARPLPGSKDALRRLQFYLERDADEYAVDRTRNPIALASAICKAAVDATTSPALASLAGSGTPARVRLLLDRAAAQPRAWANLAGRAMVAVLVALVLTTASFTPSLAQAGVASLKANSATPACQG